MQYFKSRDAASIEAYFFMSDMVLSSDQNHIFSPLMW